MNLDRSVGEHAIDVLSFIAGRQAAGAHCALAIVVGVEGASSRAVGAMMGISDSGDYAGYISNGCIDAAVAQNGLDVIKEGRMRHVRYGAGSAYVDLKLPCGGALDLVVLPAPDLSTVAAAVTRLQSRKALHWRITINGDVVINNRVRDGTSAEKFLFETWYAPPLQLALAGRGAELLAIMRLATAAAYNVVAYSPDADIQNAAADLNGVQVHSLTIDQPVRWPDDPYTAIALLFHEHEWETALLAAALETQAFYIGAMGSRKTHEARRDALIAYGVPSENVDRIHGHIGLIPSARDASTLGISALAQIVGAYNASVVARVTGDD